MRDKKYSIKINRRIYETTNCEEAHGLSLLFKGSEPKELENKKGKALQLYHAGFAQR